MSLNQLINNPLTQNAGYCAHNSVSANLISQLTGPVRWTQTVEQMIADGATHFTEAGPGKVLQGLVLKINKEVEVDGILALVGLPLPIFRDIYQV